MHVQLSNGVGDLRFGLDLHLHPYFVFASGECSGETVQMEQGFNY